MSIAPQRPVATVNDLLARSEDEHLELIRGTLIEKAAPTAEHAEAQGGTATVLSSLFRNKRNGGPGGWRFYTELDIQLGTEIFRSDVCGYRRERVQERLRGRPVKLAPDWVCEILSTSNESRDRVEKLQTYFRSGVPHYWLIDPAEGTLEVLRRTDLAYAVVLTAHRGQRVRAEPFEGAEIAIDDLLGVDESDTE